MGHLKQLEASTRTSLIRTPETILGVLATTMWAYVLSIPRTLGASGGLETPCASLRTLSEAPSEGSHADVRLGDTIR